jgi:hypothetical protein
MQLKSIPLDSRERPAQDMSKDQKDERISELEEALRVIARSSTDPVTRKDAEMVLAGNPRKRD